MLSDSARRGEAIPMAALNLYGRTNLSREQLFYSGLASFFLEEVSSVLLRRHALQHFEEGAGGV